MNKTPFYIFLLVANVFFLITNIFLILTILDTPANTYFPLIHHEQVDYYLYLAAIRESREGSWETSAFYTSESAQGSLLYISFILFGKIAAILNLSPEITYHIMRILAMELIFIFIYVLCNQLLGKKWSIWAACLSLFASVPAAEILSYFSIQSPQWWTDNLSAYARMNLLPHHAMGTVLMLISIVTFIKHLKQHKKYLYAISIITSFAASIMFPPAGIVFVFGLPLALTVYQFQKYIQHKKIAVLFTIKITILVISAAMAIFLLNFQTQKGFPWSQWRTWDMDMWNNNVINFNRDFLIGGGLTLAFSMPFIISILLSSASSFFYIFIAIWAVLPYLLLPFTDLLGIGRIRVVYMNNFIPLSIIFIYGVKVFSRHITEKGKRVSFYIFTAFIFILLNLTSTVSFFVLQFQQKTNADAGMNTYIPQSVFQSMKFFDKKEFENTVTLSDFAVGNMLPAFARAKSYFGHWTQTKDYNQKAFFMTKFYSGKMSPAEAENFIKEGRIDYIYYGSKEKSYKGNIASYKLPLKEMYNQDDIEIYEVGQFL